MRRVVAVAAFLSALAACGGGDNSELLGEMSSKNPALREDAVIDAGSTPDAEVTSALEALLLDPDPRIRLAAIEALDKHSASSSIRPLMGRVLDPDPDVARAAIDALGRTEDPAAAPALMAAVTAHFEAPPLNAVWALGQVGNRDAIPLLARLRDHGDTWVRYNATEALRQLD